MPVHHRLCFVITKMIGHWTLFFLTDPCWDGLKLTLNHGEHCQRNLKKDITRRNGRRGNLMLTGKGILWLLPQGWTFLSAMSLTRRIDKPVYMLRAGFKSHNKDTNNLIWRVNLCIDIRSTLKGQLGLSAKSISSHLTR